MKKRDNRLDRLKIGFQCQVPWESMVGDHQRRFCDECRKEVLDFAQMTTREIQDHLDASQGQTCARLTFDGQRLRVLQPIESEISNEPRSLRRGSPWAATVLTAWLGLGTMAAQPTLAEEPSPTAPLSPEESSRAQSRQPSPTQGATLRGQVKVDGKPLPGVVVVAQQALGGTQHKTTTGKDGRFVFRQLPPGVYDIRGSQMGISIEPVENVMLGAGRERVVEVTGKSTYSVTGAVVMGTFNLRDLFTSSPYVFSAKVANSRLVGIKGSHVELVTTLEVEQVVKGEYTRRTLEVWHSEYRVNPADYVSRSGMKVLAFLQRRSKEEGDDFELASYPRGLWELPEDKHQRYLERLVALADLQRDPAELTNWLVATVEDPVSRVEAASDLLQALRALEELAKREAATKENVAADLRSLLQGKLSTPSEMERPLFQAAYLTESHQQRLIDALLASETFGDGDRALFQVVDLLDSTIARDWLVGRLRNTEPPLEEAERHFWWLKFFAKELEGPKATALNEKIAQNIAEIDAALVGLERPTAAHQRREKYAALGREVQLQLAELLADPF